MRVKQSGESDVCLSSPEACGGLMAVFEGLAAEAKPEAFNIRNVRLCKVFQFPFGEFPYAIKFSQDNLKLLDDVGKLDRRKYWDGEIQKAMWYVTGDFHKRYTPTESCHFWMGYYHKRNELIENGQWRAL